MFILAGLGLNLKSISLEGIEACRKADKIYIENYTVELPYDIQEIEKTIGKKIIMLTRTIVENEKFIEEAKSKNIALLVYGSPLIATTHISLVLKCKKERIDYKIIHNASIFDAISETGLQFYKFGKTASMPKWEDNYKPDSFLKIIKDNKKIKAHTLLLVDIGLSFGNALKQLETALEKESKLKAKLKKLVVCSQLGNEKQKIYYDTIEELYEKEAYAPFCFIIPSELHFLEEEFLNVVSRE